MNYENQFKRKQRLGLDLRSRLERKIERAHPLTLMAITVLIGIVIIIATIPSVTKYEKAETLPDVCGLKVVVCEYEEKEVEAIRNM